MSLGYSSVWFKHYCPISASSCVYASLESVIPATLKLLLSHLLKMHPLTWGSYPVPWYIPYIQVVNGEALCRKGEVGVNELVQQLREMAAGSDIETAEYMIQDIFEEYRFFGQYPGDKLRTTAALMGSLIAQAVFSGRSLFIGLKMIIECFEVCSKPLDIHCVGCRCRSICYLSSECCFVSPCIQPTLST